MLGYIEFFKEAKINWSHFQFRTSVNVSTLPQRSETAWGSLSYWGRNI